MVDVVVVGAGFSGVVAARLLAEAGMKVKVLEKKDHICGMMLDYKNEDGVFVHRYGPHVLMLDEDKVFSFLSRFTELTPVHEEVNAWVDDEYIPIPVNLNSIPYLMHDGTDDLERKLIDRYGYGSKVGILELLQNDDALVRRFAETVYNKIFLGYNAKMWGKKPEEVEKTVLGRMPIRIYKGNHNSEQKYEVIPAAGYEQLFKSILDHDNIQVCLGIDGDDAICINHESGEIFLDDKVFSGYVIYTGSIDGLFRYAYGQLPYRAQNYVIKTYDMQSPYKSAVTTFPNMYAKTRTTDMGKLMMKENPSRYTEVSEYPGEYVRGSELFNEPAYPVRNNESDRQYRRYEELAAGIPRLFCIGRLGEFKYYNMEKAILSAFECARRICAEKEGIV